MLRGLMDAISVLTIVSISSGRRPIGVHAAIFYVSFLFVGMFFGVPAMMLVMFGGVDIRYFIAWGVPVFWLVLSGFRHFDGLCRVIGALFHGRNASERVKQLTQPVALDIAVIFALLIVMGKTFAILQAGALDARTLSYVLLLVPIYSRFMSVMFALSAENSNIIGSQESSFVKAGIVIVSIAVLGLVSFSVPALGLMLLVLGLMVALVGHILSVQFFGGIKPATIGAFLEFCEVIMLWGVILFSASVQNLTFF